MTRTAQAIIVAVALLFPRVAGAQGMLFGSFGAVIGQGYEDNIFARPIGALQQSDAVTRIGPSAEAGYRSDGLRWTGRYEAAGERYWRLQELNRPIARQDAAFDLTYHPSRQVTIADTNLYASTYSPLELGTLDAVALGRVHADRLTLRPAVTWESSAANRVTFDYEFSREAVAGLAHALIQTPRVAFAHKATRRTTYRVDYRLRRFESSGLAPEGSQVVAVGVDGEIGRSASVRLEAGPRLFQGAVRPEVRALLRRPLRRTELSLEFAQTEATVLGEEGIMDVRELRAGIRTQASREIALTAAPTVFRDRRADRYATVEAMEMEAVAQLARGVSLTVSGQFGQQQGNLSGAYERIPYYSVGTTLRVALASGNAVRNGPDGAARDGGRAAGDASKDR